MTVELKLTNGIIGCPEQPERIDLHFWRKLGCGHNGSRIELATLYPRNRPLIWGMDYTLLHLIAVGTTLNSSDRSDPENFYTNTKHL